MDFIDKLAIFLSGGNSSNIPQNNCIDNNEQREEKEQKPAKRIKITGVNSIGTFKDVLHTPKITSFEESEKAQKNLKEILESKRESFGDSIIENTTCKSFNDVVSANLEVEEKRFDKEDKDVLNKVMPFLDEKTDFGIWVYNNRFGIIITLSVYIVIVASMMFANLSLSSVDFSNSVYVDIPYEEAPKEKQPEPEPEKKPMEEMFGDGKVENILVDKNTELNAEIKDDRNTKTSDLYREAQQAQANLDANREAYKSGLDGVAAIKREAKKTNKNQEASKKSINKQGNVTVSYDLKGRYVVVPEIPAYRCKGAGKVLVDIVVGQNGKVISASINSIIGVDDECLPMMSIEAAKNTEFNIDYDAPEKQKGLIAFVFVAQ